MNNNSSSLSTNARGLTFWGFLDAASRVFLWIMAAAAVWPYWWLDIWTRANGERPGNEGEGMIGFLIMLFAGPLALSLAIVNEVRLCRRRNQQIPASLQAPVP